MSGLETRPAQVWGAVRLVPLVRREPVTDFRLHRRLYEEPPEPAPGRHPAARPDPYRTPDPESDPYRAPSVVAVAPRRTYTAYVPHGFVATWTRDGTPAAAFGTQLSDGTTDAPPTAMGLRFHRRTARREAKDRLRFLPQHLALEGYLALHFGGPTTAWEEWSARALAQGLSPRAEEAYTGAGVRGPADALRVFEIHPGQCGLLLYTGDALAAAFVVPHPEDYRALHPSLLQDLYGELVHHYATLMPAVPEFRARVDGAGIGSLAELRAAAREQEEEWAAFHDSVMAGGLLGAEYTWEEVYRAGRFTLSRFLPSFRRREENHIGEAVTDERGRFVYLKTFRLGERQVRRGHLLAVLAAHDWHLGAAAAALGIDAAALGLRLESAGFGHLLRQDVLDGYRAARRRAGAGSGRRGGAGGTGGR
ncbi:hypothetical protein [Streptomyces sp. NPDC097619]|uniref:ARPP-2 domain-containing protein n=1 Tax=Streptomyces sp. NPDC097619 TaxID=3157228 RepID=UPI003328D2B6